MQERQPLLPLTAFQWAREKGRNKCTGVTCAHFQPALVVFLREGYWDVIGAVGTQESDEKVSLG